LRASETRQLEVGRLFVTVRQKRSSFGFGGPAFANPPLPLGTLLVVTRSTHSAALAATGFGLRFQLFQLGFLLSGQDGLHLLIELDSLAHQFGLQARHFR
jgi:hypothetical protein